MINIAKQLWYVVDTTREDSLAYMTYYEDNAAFEKRKGTGLSWASGKHWDYSKKEYVYNNTGDGVIIDNSPTTGIYIGSSVSRWSTNNKLFRVKDPRGFTVEVPTDNIATLLHLTTVKNGVVEEPCVWGRDGSNHILLPVNSEPYLETLAKMDVLANKLIKIGDLKVGDKVKFFEDKTERTYLGKAKVTWRIKPWEYKYGRHHYGYNRDNEKIYLEEKLVKDTKWEHIFAEEYINYKEEDTISFTNKNNPKITEIVSNVKDVSELRNKLTMYIPDRVLKQANVSYYECDRCIESVEWK